MREGEGVEDCSMYTDPENNPPAPAWVPWLLWAHAFAPRRLVAWHVRRLDNQTLAWLAEAARGGW